MLILRLVTGKAGTEARSGLVDRAGAQGIQGLVPAPQMCGARSALWWAEPCPGVTADSRDLKTACRLTGRAMSLPTQLFVPEASQSWCLQAGRQGGGFVLRLIS